MKIVFLLSGAIAVIVLPSPRVNVFSPAKQASKQRDSPSGSLLFVHRRRRLGGFGGRRLLGRQLWNRNAVGGQQPPQASIFFAETNVFLLGGFERKEL
jgi:hypothetical protein